MADIARAPVPSFRLNLVLTIGIGWVVVGLGQGLVGLGWVKAGLRWVGGGRGTVLIW